MIDVRGRQCTFGRALEHARSLVRPEHDRRATLERSAGLEVTQQRATVPLVIARFAKGLSEFSAFEYDRSRDADCIGYIVEMG